MTIAVLDVSGSIVEPGGPDELGRAFGEIEVLAELLAQRPCSDSDRIAGVLFADDVRRLPAAMVSDTEAVRSTFTRPPTGSIGRGTNLSGALAVVREIVTDSPGFAHLVVVVSDMAADDPDAARVAIEALDDSELHLVVLGDGATALASLFASVTVVDDVNTFAMARSLAAAVAASRSGTP
jgi:hypothetical protein